MSISSCATYFICERFIFPLAAFELCFYFYHILSYFILMFLLLTYPSNSPLIQSVVCVSFHSNASFNPYLTLIIMS
ncbi:hypothetical protein BO86DRAFT_25450 [Aspergillus japonicus CBS 114.51]|uniref:Uncharacterized protein n=2 Tax=Aspergillus TaxID=5052 RepID=A0A2V5HY04_ASPV1|nr:hypothetical protein BO86DRAFT_25450 [Aspergillus japonicus CBS 114.51]PYI16747.1 hypothetical protein BO99DRAFT_213854 [Aspergillus violaceofuscus CBS 115571]RAH83996.1 hypothetical protein BO86DRAFT_25450 [Aspergillus japonicus CBS 114.51]